MYSTIDSRLAPLLRKRERQDVIQLIDHEYESRVDDDNRESLKKQKSSHQDPDLLHGHIILHRVTCDRKKSHERHEDLAYYFDIPGLFAGDSKASTLRGRRPVSKVEEYLEDQAGISIVAYKKYDCRKHYEVVQDQFERLPTPDHPADVASLMPYFFRLNKDSIHAVPQSWEIKIQSLTLKEAIQVVTGIGPDRLTDWQNRQCISGLYHLFYHCRRLKGHAAGLLSDLQRREFQLLLDFVNEAFGADYDEADDLFSCDLVAKSHLHKLFGPNDIIVTVENGQSRAYAVECCPQSNTFPLELDCWSWEFDGLFRKERVNIYVDWPSSSETKLPITTLTAYPLRLDRSGLVGLLRKRGEKFWSCRSKNLVSFNPISPRWQMPASNSRYMIDMTTYRESNDISELPRQRNDLGHEAMSQDHPPDDPFSLLLPAEIIGFGFHDRKWRSLTVDDIGEISWNRKAFEHLVIDSDHKDVIEALVTSHTAASKSTDFMEGKGNGLILLLHGGPGTGKTLTAESVAELTHKPLYRIACGDIGTNVEEVEKYLKSVLYIGTIWKCVVLLDEADVFLEERQTDQLQRNALVSIFLRTLEYYDGILILTSNRVGTFDEAFKSRIQVSLHYPYLNKQSRYRIWLNFIDSLNETDAKVEEIKKGVNFLAKQRLNGREIRNTVKLAMQLAQFHGKRLEYSHLERIMDISTKFADYLKDVHGHSDSEWALNKGLRGQERKRKT